MRFLQELLCQGSEKGILCRITFITVYCLRFLGFGDSENLQKPRKFCVNLLMDLILGMVEEVGTRMFEEQKDNKAREKKGKKEKSILGYKANPARRN